MLRRMISGGFRRQTGAQDSDKTFKYHYKSEDILRIANIENVSTFIMKQQKKYTAHIIRFDPNMPAVQLMFNADKYRKGGNQAPELFKQVIKNEGGDQKSFIAEACQRRFWDFGFGPANRRENSLHAVNTMMMMKIREKLIRR